MTAALLAPAASNETRRAPTSFPIRLRGEDSLRRIALPPPQPISAAMIGICAGSLVVHAALLAVTIATNRAQLMPPHQEIAVEVVQEAPKPPEPVKPPLRLDQAKSESPKAPVSPAEPPKPLPSKQDIAKPAAAKSEATKVEPPKPTPMAQQTPQDAKPAAAPSDAEALRKELAELQAQQAALKSEARALEPPPEAAGGGPLKGSQQALALPSVGGGDGDVVGYQEVVFSQLAKAKGMDEYKGDPGTTGIRFEIDDAGKLVSAQVAVSSGKAGLDEKALDIVNRAAPFPAPPKDGEHVFFANVNFRPAKRS